MKTKPKRTGKWLLPLLTLLPAALIALFFPLRSHKALMNHWVFEIIGPFEQFLGRICSVFSFSVVELLGILIIGGSILWVVFSLVQLLWKRQLKRFLHRLLPVLTVWLWVLAIFYWFWNTTYYASTFSERAGLESRTYSVEELAAVTDYFAQNAARLAGQVQRDEELHYRESLDSIFDRAPALYENITEIFPCLEMDSVRPKPFLLSRLQSILGFTGMYGPFTGEANINVDAPNCLIPSTIGHEMSHQRMVALEQEANFVGITACTVSDDPVFQYSGYLCGLIHLCNALYPVAPELWGQIADARFTPELARDWNDNNAYWRELSSPVEEVADQAYDAFLKSNDQELGMKSYGACVDLLIAYHAPEVLGN